MPELLTIKEASIWATDYLKKYGQIDQRAKKKEYASR